MVWAGVCGNTKGENFIKVKTTDETSSENKLLLIPVMERRQESNKSR